MAEKFVALFKTKYLGQYNYYVMAHAQKPVFVPRLNGGNPPPPMYFSGLLAPKMCTGIVLLRTECPLHAPATPPSSIRLLSFCHHEVVVT